MLFSLALIFIVGFTMGGIFKKLKLPEILGMLLTGIVLGPFVMDMISSDILDISNELRQIALILILGRAGLSLSIKDLKKVGRPAILMCFIPATFEIIGVMIFAPMIFGISLVEAAIMGCVLAAVSPAIIVPRMIKIMEEGYGKEKSIAQLVLAGASVDDVYVIVLFTSFLNIYSGKNFELLALLSVPVSIIVGVIIGIIIGIFISFLIEKFYIRDTTKALLFLSVGFLLVAMESKITSYIPMSGLLAVMALGATILRKNEILSARLSKKLSKMWVGAELLLFVLVGASLDISYTKEAGIMVIAFILIALTFRTLGVCLSLIKTKLNKNEKIFCVISYIPKATVQAAIGAVPLSQGVNAGNLILTVAVVSIIITAPLGAIGVDYSYKKLLSK